MTRSKKSPKEKASRSSQVIVRLTCREAKVEKLRPEEKGRPCRINKTGKVISHFLVALEWLGGEEDSG